MLTKIRLGPTSCSASCIGMYILRLPYTDLRQGWYCFVAFLDKRSYKDSES